MEIMGDTTSKTTSDSEYDYICSPCNDEGLNKEAQYFCGECAQFYCNECEQLHKKIRKRHAVLGREDIGQWLQAPIQSLVEDLERCETHQNKALELYCGGHDKLCCHLCVANNHSNCLVVKHIPVLARGFRETEEFKKLPDEVEELRNQLQEFKESREKSKENIETSRDNVLENIKAFREKMNGLLDVIEKNTIKEMKIVMAPLVESLTNDVDKCEDMRDRLKRLIDDIKTKTTTSESLSYVGFTKCKSLMSEANSVCKEMITTKDYELVFQPGTNVETTVSSIDIFGDIFDANHIFTVQSQKSITTNKSNQWCAITGVCEMPNGNIVLCKREPKCEVILLDQYFNETTRLEVPNYTDGICAIDEMELAVAINMPRYKSESLRLIQVAGGKLKVTKQLKLAHCCLSVAHHDSQLYVTSEAALYQYTKSGKLVKQLYEDKTVNANGKTSNVLKCAVNHDGSKMFILNKKANQILTIDRDGNILSEIKDAEISEPCGICVSSFGYVFVACSNYVWQMDRIGEKKLTKIAKISLYCKVTSLCHVKNTNSLIMSPYDFFHEGIHILKLN
ncbi:hypothetical protein MAR_011354 [Mya arenaria]|uniref:B box-type domain-containing protein n=1 Tax=Mya arenaria TaxID=6604 RepID=A0ABY7FUL1_MYAAR|nr:uncharacterized protein LOC128215782 [Mya arenaria]WAR25650.1 hypothetical protein MAR_011354 [Mya arenaria]